MEHALSIPKELFEALAQRAAEIVCSRPPERRWLVGIEGLAGYLGCSQRLARELRAKGLPAQKVGKRLYFDMREVNEFLAREGAAS
jgi:hypothetical protein